MYLGADSAQAINRTFNNDLFPNTLLNHYTSLKHS